MDRRDFLRSGCRACAALALVPAVATLESCSSTSATPGLAVADGQLNIPINALSGGPTTVINAKGLGDKLLIVKGDEGYRALVLNCTHKGGPVKESGGSLSCSWHGSTFDMTGQVTKGPAKEALKTYPTELVGDVLRVRIA